MTDLHLIRYHWAGDPAQMQQNYDAVLEKVVAIQPARPLVHLAFHVDDGFVVVDVWNDKKVADTLHDNPDFQRVLAEHGLGEAQVTRQQLHRLGWPVSEVPAYR